MRSIICSLFTIVILLTVLNSCGGNVENEIIGSWRANTNDFVFKSDNTFEHISYPPKRVSKGTYEIFDGNKVKLKYNRLKFDVIHTASISGNKLKLTNGDGKSARFKRIPNKQ